MKRKNQDYRDLITEPQIIQNSVSGFIKGLLDGCSPS